MGHLGAVDGIEAAASRRPDRAAAVGLQDSEERVLARPPPPGAAGALPSEGKRRKPCGEGSGAPWGVEQQSPRPGCRWTVPSPSPHALSFCCIALKWVWGRKEHPGAGALAGCPLAALPSPHSSPESPCTCSVLNLRRGLFYPKPSAFC